ncbi:copper resistance protein NlpE N-terminal domain-containing protein [Congregibacter sp.]|uniref:copper resistance protein NlpE N-terminal domain-containing protein n=1 Tax=Congregibacter sp. TaxID=2744308 RepID=UPI003F6D43BD
MVLAVTPWLRPTTALGVVLVAFCLLWPQVSQAQVEQPPAFLGDGAASYEGRLPCADCPGVYWKLDLWPEGRFHLRQEYLDRDSVTAHRGQWVFEPDAQRLALLAPGQDRIFLAVASTGVLELLDREGETIDSKLNYGLERQAVFEPGEFPVSLTGVFRYFADAASFMDCSTGYRYAVAMAGNYPDLERRYLSGGPGGGAPWLIQVDAQLRNKAAMEGEGALQSLFIDSFRPLGGDACPHGNDLAF